MVAPAGGPGRRVVTMTGPRQDRAATYPRQCIVDLGWRHDVEQGHRPDLEVAVYPSVPLQVLQAAGRPATASSAT